MSALRLRYLIPLLLCLACGEGRIRQPPPATAPPPPPATASGELQLSVRAYTRPYEVGGFVPPQGQAFLSVEVDVINPTGTTRRVRWDMFSLETDVAVHIVSELTAQTPAACDTNLGGNARVLCPGIFQVSAGATPMTVILHSELGDVRTSFDGVTAPPAACPVSGPESDFAACTDGCNNDGDLYVDCDDADCCPHLTECMPGTHCGGPEIECVAGPEDTLSGCRDRCDNDGDGYQDCNDHDCCDLIACGGNTSCAARPDPFAEPAVFDDSAVTSTDPSTLLTGDAPCRPPVLARVRFAPDGDTISVDPLDGSSVEGSVRLIGVDTPEIGRDGQPSDCYAEQASAWTQSLVGRMVWLTFDRECRDRFDRHLAHVHYGPHRTHLVQRQLLRRGLARAYTVGGNDSLAELLAHDEGIASAAALGLWSACP